MFPRRYFPARQFAPRYFPPATESYSGPSRGKAPRIVSVALQPPTVKAR